MENLLPKEISSFRWWLNLKETIRFFNTNMKYTSRLGTMRYLNFLPFLFKVCLWLVVDCFHQFFDIFFLLFVIAKLLYLRSQSILVEDCDLWEDCLFIVAVKHLVTSFGKHFKVHPLKNLVKGWFYVIWVAHQN